MMLLEESLQVGKDKTTLRLAHTKEPVFVEHRDGNGVTGYSWHPVQTRLHANLAMSSEFGSKQLTGPWDSVDAAREDASKLYERGAQANFKDKIPSAVHSTIHHSEGNVPYQEVHYLDPDSRDVIVTAYKEAGNLHGRCVKPHTINDEYTKDLDPSEIDKLKGDHPYQAYHTAVAIHGMTASKPYAIKLHSNKAHAVYKTAKSPEDASAMHEKSLLAQHKGGRIKRHTPTAFELQDKGKVIHSFTVPGQIHEINGGPLNVDEGSLQLP